jgi:hypothetical protein
MSKIKLKEWADRHNLSYLTANRHFHAGMIPGAVQLDSGTILVEDDTLEQNMAGSSTNDAMSLFLKKTVEFSKNNSSVEDFAAYVISNFQIKMMNVAEPSPRYSRVKPKPEQVQAHFQQFLPDKEKEDHLRTIKSLIKEQNKGDARYESPAPATINFEEPNSFNRVVDTVTNDMSEEFANIGQILSAAAPTNSDVRMYGPETATEGLVSRSVDFNTTPQQINYTGSTSQAFSSSSSIAEGLAVNSSHLVGGAPFGGVSMNAVFLASPASGTSVPFQPTQKELLSASQVIETAETDDLAETDSLPRKRGRKPSKKR